MALTDKYMIYIQSLLSRQCKHCVVYQVEDTSKVNKVIGYRY